jgi:hypothetical protein
VQTTQRRDVCERLATCPFFNGLSLPSVAETLKVLYCKGDYLSCARYRLAQAGAAVPLDLWPNGPKAVVPASR